jgi:hypothetical protein
MNTTSTPTLSRNFKQSFDTRLMLGGAITVAAMVIAAFVSIARPAVNTTRASAPVYDGAGASRWPTS